MWVDVPQGYDAPPGEKARIIYRVELPFYVWDSGQARAMIDQQIASIWASIERSHPEFRPERYEVVEVTPPRVWNVVIYGTSLGVPLWVVAVVILSLLAALAILVNVTIDKVQKWVPPETAQQLVNMLPFILLFGLVVMVAIARR